ncbi:metallophosphoesterase [Arenibacter lacus]|uniref:metallophosphoesterase n=1 Tax=Arenibacter lacus TaxID=2608629 RepID=UPI00123CFB47|nr:metallophosphoesterase [Arenibacter lacus]
MIDLIGDIHGYADELEELLEKLGYAKKDNHYAHPNRKVLFVGDYIDRGPKIRGTLEIVKQMVDHGSAIALIGNHEYNALCFYAQDSDGKYLREHSEKNKGQLQATIDQFKNREEEFKMYLEWFKTLPLFYETDTFRAVHACWDYKSIAYLKQHLNNNKLNDDLLRESVKKGTELYNAIENTLKGKEIPLPGKLFFKDKDGNERRETRIRWWEDPSQMTYEEISVHAYEGLPNIPIDVNDLKDTDYYEKGDKPVFFGHYWLTEGQPSLFKDNICCLDYSVAKDGYLVAYSFDGESALDGQKFTYE